MKLNPTPGLVFIIEDKKQTDIMLGGGTVKFVAALQNPNVASIGRIYCINPLSLCPHCTHQYKRDDLKVGDHVVYSKFASEHIEIKDIEQQEGGRLFSLPIDSVYAVLSD